MADLITRVRAMAADVWKLHQDTATGDGSTKTYWLDYKPEKSGGTVSLGGTVQGTAVYGWDLTFGRVEFTTAPGNGIAIVVEYQASEFTDDDLEDVLDGHVTHVEEQPLRWLPDSEPGGSIAYYRAALGYRDLEGTASGTIYWNLLDSTGSAVPAYTPDYITGQVRFTADTSGSSYYWTGRSYDLFSAAADIWERKAAGMADWYQFESEGQRFSRHQAFDHAREMAAIMRARAGQNVQAGAMKTNVFLRTDLQRRD
jgi:hypothetical protein